MSHSGKEKDQRALKQGSMKKSAEPSRTVRPWHHDNFQNFLAAHSNYSGQTIPWGFEYPSLTLTDQARGGLSSERARKVLISTYSPAVVSHSRARLFVTPWTAAHQVPLSMRFSRQGYWSGLPFPSPPILQTWLQFLLLARDQDPGSKKATLRAR